MSLRKWEREHEVKIREDVARCALWISKPELLLAYKCRISGSISVTTYLKTVSYFHKKPQIQQVEAHWYGESKHSKNVRFFSFFLSKEREGVMSGSTDNTGRTALSILSLR